MKQLDLHAEYFGGKKEKSRIERAREITVEFLWCDHTLNLFVLVPLIINIAFLYFDSFCTHCVYVYICTYMF